MELAWPDRSTAFQYAFGLKGEPLAKCVVLLHKDRLSELEMFLPTAEPFKGRWYGLRTEDRRLAFIPVPQGASDVCDCLLHLAAFPPSRIIFTGTCGSLVPRIEIGDVCYITEGWLVSGGIQDCLDRPLQMVNGADFIKAADATLLPIFIEQQLKERFDLKLQSAKVFSIPFQALESPAVIAAMRDLGVEVVDMESTVFLAITKRLKIPACCYLWCTDIPASASYYEQVNKPVLEIRQKRWEGWPEIVVRVADV